MIIGKVRITGAHAWVEELRTVTALTVGAEVALEFDEEWEGLTKTAVFLVGNRAKDVLVTGSAVRIPAELLSAAGEQIRVGVYGTGAADTLVIPTVWANLGLIREGTEPSGDMAAEAVLPLWQQALGAVGDLAELKTADTSSLVAAINSVNDRIGENGGGGLAIYTGEVEVE